MRANKQSKGTKGLKKGAKLAAQKPLSKGPQVYLRYTMTDCN